jgi:hypothetical protein
LLEVQNFEQGVLSTGCAAAIGLHDWVVTP